MNMAKKYLAAVMAIVLIAGILTGCGAKNEKNVTMEQLREANQLNALLEDHESMSYQLVGVMDGAINAEMYSTKELCYGDYGDQEQIITLDWSCLRSDDNFAPVVELASREDMEEVLQEQFLNVGVKTEEVTSCRMENGMLAITTEMSKEDSEYIFSLIGDPNAYKSDDILRMEYVADPDTLHFVKTVMFLVDKDGKSCEVFHLGNIEYDVEAPAAVKECTDEYFRIQSAEEGTRTVTVVIDPGTAEEQIKSVKAELGNWASVNTCDDYPNLYLDAECTEIFDGYADTYKDATLYASRGK